MNKENVQENNCETNCSCSQPKSCKATMVFIIALVLAAIAYVGFWHYTAAEIKADVEQKLAQEPFKAIKYDAVVVTGFPMEYNVEIIKPNFEYENEAQKLRVEVDKVAVKAQREANAYQATIGDVVLSGEYTLPNGEKESYVERFDYSAPAVIDIALDANNALTSIAYKDRGYKVSYNDVLVGTNEGINVAFSKGTLEDSKHFYSIKGSSKGGSVLDVKEYPKLAGLSEEAGKQLLALIKKTGKVSSEIDVTLTYKGPAPQDINFEDPASIGNIEEVSLNIGKLSMKNDKNVGYEFSGDIGVKMPVPVPAVDLKLDILKVDDVLAFIKDFMAVLPILVEEAKTEDMSVDESESLAELEGALAGVNDALFEKTKEFLYAISDNPSEKAENLRISIKSQENGGYTVGTLGLMELEPLYSQIFAEEGETSHTFEPLPTEEETVAPEASSEMTPEEAEEAAKELERMLEEAAAAEGNPVDLEVTVEKPVQQAE